MYTEKPDKDFEDFVKLTESEKNYIIALMKQFISKHVQPSYPSAPDGCTDRGTED